MTRAEVLAAVSAPIARRLALYADLLVRWQATINLVAPATVAELWTRHIADSMQVAAAAPAARRWVDFGSGGGFPGLVTAILLSETDGAEVHLVESDKRKAAFLRTAARETGAPAIVHAERIERFVPAFERHVEAVSARALAPLAQLVAYAEPFLRAGAVAIFPKGQTAANELTGFDRDNRFVIESIPSRTDEAACLLIVRMAGRSAPA